MIPRCAIRVRARQTPSMLRFSIIIPTYNYAHYLPRALESALAQRGEDYEIIVVDDGSIDGTRDLVAASRSRANGKLVYLFQQNCGLAAARNRGIRESKGEYLLFLDADDALIPDVFERFRLTLNTHGSFDYFLGDRVVVQSKGKVTRRNVQRLSTDGRENMRTYFRESFTTICNGSVLIHRRIFDRIVFPESARLWEDQVFHSHLLALFQGHLLGYPVVTIYRHDDSLSHNVHMVRQEGPKTVKLLFDPNILPMDLMSLEKEYVARIQLAVFQRCYSRGMYKEAGQAYREAFLASPLHALRPKALRRYLKTRLRTWV